MPDFEDPKTTPTKKDWFDRLPLKTRGLLLALLMFAVSAVMLYFGIHDMLAVKPISSLGGGADWGEALFFSAGSFVLGALLLAVAMGWLRLPKPEATQNQTRK
jgi:hypothetical protein